MQLFIDHMLKSCILFSSCFRMEENLNKLERQEQDALERWRIRSERAGLALDKLEGQISVLDDPIGNDIETVRRQEDAFEVSTFIFLLQLTTVLLKSNT